MKPSLLLNLKIKRKCGPDHLEGSVRHYINPTDPPTLTIGSGNGVFIKLPDVAAQHLVLQITAQGLQFQAHEATNLIFNGQQQSLAAGQTIEWSNQELLKNPVNIQLAEHLIKLRLSLDLDVLPLTSLQFLEKNYGPLVKIGQGGIATVYRTLESPPLALKILMPSLAKDERVVKRFLLAAKDAGRFSHPGLLSNQQSRSFPKAGLFLQVMDYFPGETLQCLVGRLGPQSLEQSCKVITMVSRALAYLHHHAIIHRDLTHKNILVGDQGEAKVIGFSLIKSAKRELTMAGTTMASPNFTSPEQLLNPKDVDVRTDIFSLGAVFFTLLAGTPPFGAKGIREYGDLICDDACPVFPQAVQPPQALQKLIITAMACQASKRPPNVQVWFERLSKAIVQSAPANITELGLDQAAREMARYSTAARPVPTAGDPGAGQPAAAAQTRSPAAATQPKTARPGKAGRGVQILVAVLLLLALAGAGALFFFQPPAPSPRKPKPKPQPAPQPSVLSQDIRIEKTAYVSRTALLVFGRVVNYNGPIQVVLQAVQGKYRQQVQTQTDEHEFVARFDRLPSWGSYLGLHTAGVWKGYRLTAQAGGKISAPYLLQPPRKVLAEKQTLARIINKEAYQLTRSLERLVKEYLASRNHKEYLRQLQEWHTQWQRFHNAIPRHGYEDEAFKAQDLQNFSNKLQYLEKQLQGRFNYSPQTSFAELLELLGQRKILDEIKQLYQKMGGDPLTLLVD